MILFVCGSLSALFIVNLWNISTGRDEANEDLGGAAAREPVAELGCKCSLDHVTEDCDDLALSLSSNV